MLSAKDLKTMRHIVTAYYPDLISIYNVTVTYGQYGQATTTSGLVTTVSGQLSQPSGRESPLIEALRKQGVLEDETMRLALPYGTALTTNQVVVTSGNKVWNVAHVDSSYTFTAATVAIITRREVKPSGDDLQT